MGTRLFHLFQGFSLDVAFGGMIFSMALHRYFEVAINAAAIFSLGACIWLVYTLDHLMDARKIRHEKIPIRYLLHRQHATKISVVMIVLVIILGFLAFSYLPFSLRFYGAMMVCFVGAYFFITQKNMDIQKEFLVAFGYTFGIVLAPVTQTQKVIGMQEVLLLCIIFLIAYFNVLLFAVIEESEDKRMGFASIVTKKGTGYVNSLMKILIGCYSVGWLAWIFLNMQENWLLSLSLLAMGGTLVFLWKMPKLHQSQIYRIIGDGIFYLPGFILFIG